MKKLYAIAIALLLIPSVAYARPTRPIVAKAKVKVIELQEQIDTLTEQVASLESRLELEWDTQSNLKVGYGAGRNQHAFGNTFVGTFAGYYCLDGRGDQSNIFGAGAAGKWCTGSNNVVNGNGAAYQATHIDRSVITGLCAGCSATEIVNSVLIGEDVMSDVTGRIENVIAIGQGTARNATVKSNALYISDLIFADYTARYMRVHGTIEAERVKVGTATLFVEDNLLKVEMPDGTLRTIQTE